MTTFLFFTFSVKICYTKLVVKEVLQFNLFLEPLKKRRAVGKPAALFLSKNSRYQAQGKGPYNPFVLCRMFATRKGGKLRLLCFGLEEKAQK